MSDVGRKRTSFEKDELLILREKYGVSISMLLNRMKSLDIISAEIHEKYKQFDAKGDFKVKKEESEESKEYEKPRLIRKLVYRAVAEGVISEQRGFELLGEDGGLGSRLGRTA
jgi:Zn-dependent peptidase ImmA (M78 family)